VVLFLSFSAFSLEIVVVWKVVLQIQSRALQFAAFFCYEKSSWLWNQMF
jgi:hypothetical protein